MESNHGQPNFPSLKKELGYNQAGENLAGAGRIMQFPRAADAQVKQYPVTVHQMVITAGLGKNSRDEKGQFKG